jgi:hypothetical protein
MVRHINPHRTPAPGSYIPLYLIQPLISQTARSQQLYQRRLPPYVDVGANAGLGIRCQAVKRPAFSVHEIAQDSHESRIQPALKPCWIHTQLGFYCVCHWLFADGCAETERHRGGFVMIHPGSTVASSKSHRLTNRVAK